MKFAFILVGLQTVVSSAGAIAQRAAVVLAETGKPVSITFTKPGNPDDSYAAFQIDNGVKRFYFQPRSPVIKIPATSDDRQQRAIWTHIPGVRIHPSHFFLTGEYRGNGTRHTVLFFLSEGYASDAAPLLVIAFAADGSPYKTFERELDLAAFKAASDGAILIGKTTLSEAMGCIDGSKSNKATATTYDPFSAFLIKAGLKAFYSLAESRAYNKQHYVWAGPHSREDYAVFYNLPGKPKLIGAPASQLSTLLGPCK